MSCRKPSLNSRRLFSIRLPSCTAASPKPRSSSSSQVLRRGASRGPCCAPRDGCGLLGCGLPLRKGALYSGEGGSQRSEGGGGPMPRLSPSPSFSSMLFSPSQSGCPRSRSRSGTSSSLSKLSLSGPSTPTPIKHVSHFYYQCPIWGHESAAEGNRGLPASESGKHEKLGFGLMVFCLPG